MANQIHEELVTISNFLFCTLDTPLAYEQLPVHLTFAGITEFSVQNWVLLPVLNAAMWASELTMLSPLIDRRQHVARKCNNRRQFSATLISLCIL